MNQNNLPFFGTGVISKIAPGFELLEPPAVVSNWYVSKCKTFRQACRMAWQMRRVRNMTYEMFSAYGGFTRQHVGDWFNKDDKPTRRSMPAHCIAQSEAIVGNKLISQWVAVQCGLTVLEVIQLEMAAPQRIEEALV